MQIKAANTGEYADEKSPPALERKRASHLVPISGACHLYAVQVIAKRTLMLFWSTHPQAEAPLRTWFAIASAAEWTGPADIKAQFRAADFVGDSRVIFNVGGNKYRLVIHVAYPFRRVLVKFIGTHAEYDRINPEAV